MTPFAKLRAITESIGPKTPIPEVLDHVRKPGEGAWTKESVEPPAQAERRRVVRRARAAP